MTARDVLVALRRLGANIRLVGDQLKFEAGRYPIEPRLAFALAAVRVALVELLRVEPSAPEADACAQCRVIPTDAHLYERAGRFLCVACWRAGL